MKISIITAVFNRAQTIGQALDSVKAQTHPDIEHIIVDGASGDGTLTEVRARQHDRMTILSEPDKGVYDALNKGIGLANGDIIGLLHSDDFFAHERVVETVASAFADPSVDAVYSDLDYVSAKNPAQVIRRWRAGVFQSAKLRRGWMPPHPTLFLRRHVFERWGTYDTRYRIAADYDAILRWFSQHDFRAAYLPEVLVKMRVGGASNGSLDRIWRKSREDYASLRSNQVGGFATLALKNAGKLHQFFLR